MEASYLNANLVPKESQLIPWYTKACPYLGANPTQRNESMHPVIKQSLAPQLSLEQGAEKLVQQLHIIGRRINQQLDTDRSKIPYLLAPVPLHLLSRHGYKPEDY